MGKAFPEQQQAKQAERPARSNLWQPALQTLHTFHSGASDKPITLTEELNTLQCGDLILTTGDLLRHEGVLCECLFMW